MKTAVDNDRYLDLKGLSEYASIPVRTLRDYLHDPDDPLPSYALKRKIYVKKSQYDRWMEAHRTVPHDLTAMVDEVMSGLDA